MTVTRTATSRVLLLLLLLLVAACRSSSAEYSQTAQEDFSKQYSCPKDRVTTTVRPDLSAYTLSGAGPSTPPKEVAADPGRLAEWKKHEAETEAGYRNFTIVQTRGCGHEVYYLCSLANSTHEQIVPACSTASHPPK